MLVLLLLAAALALAFANGANDNFKATATLYGSGNLAYDPARRLATVAQIAGAIASVVWAAALLRAFSGKGLVPAEVVGDPTFLVPCSLLGTPAVSLPVLHSEGLPLGLQLIGFVDRDAAMFAAARAILSLFDGE